MSGRRPVGSGTSGAWWGGCTAAALLRAIHRLAVPALPWTARCWLCAAPHPDCFRTSGAHTHPTPGVIGNWLVCLAVWQGNQARDFAGKAIGVW